MIAVIYVICRHVGKMLAHLLCRYNVHIIYVSEHTGKVYFQWKYKVYAKQLLYTTIVWFDHNTKSWTSYRKLIPNLFLLLLIVLFMFTFISVWYCFFYRKKSVDPTYYTSQGIISGSPQMFRAVEGRSTPTGLESACTVSNKLNVIFLTSS